MVFIWSSINANEITVADSSSHIGSKIAVTSKLGVRYEGYLRDASEATISIDTVRVVGDLDNPVGGYLPLDDEFYDFIIFRDAEIKTIEILVPLSSESVKME